MNIEEKIGANFSSPQQKAVVNTQLTAAYLAGKFSKFMSQFDLSMAQFNILRILRGANCPLTISTIKDRMIEKSPNTTRLLDKLLEKNFIARKICKADKRQSFVEITEYGLEILKQIDDSNFSKMINPVGISDQEAELLSNLLNRLRGSF